MHRSPFRDPQFVKISIISVAVISLIVDILYDFTVNIPRSGLGYPYITFRKLYYSITPDFFLNIITVCLAFTIGIYAYITAAEYTRKIDESDDPEKIGYRKLLQYIIIYISIAKFDEAFYLLFTGNINAFMNGFVEIYIVLELMVLIVFINIISTIIFHPHKSRTYFTNTTISTITFVCFFSGVILMNMYGIDRDLFIEWIFFAVGVQLTVIIIGIVITAGLIVMSSESDSEKKSDIKVLWIEFKSGGGIFDKKKADKKVVDIIKTSSETDMVRVRFIIRSVTDLIILMILGASLLIGLAITDYYSYIDYVLIANRILRIIHVGIYGVIIFIIRRCFLKSVK